MSVYPGAAVTQLTVAELPKNVTKFLFQYLMCNNFCFNIFYTAFLFFPHKFMTKFLP